MRILKSIDSLSYRLRVDQSGACCRDRWCVDNAWHVLRMFPPCAFAVQMPDLGSETMAKREQIVRIIKVNEL